MTERGGKDVKKSRRVSEDLTPYRKLVTLQKQMIELQQQYEKTKRECDALRGRVKKEPVVLPPPPAKTDLRQSARKAIKGLHGRAVKKFKPIMVIGSSIAGATQKFVKAVGR